MRLRLESSPPLPRLKIWVPLPSPAPADIAAFKTALITDIPALSQISETTLELEIDGYALLDSTPISILRENDLLLLRSTAPSLKGKRPASPVQHDHPVAKKQKRVHPSPSSSSSSSSSSSDSDSDSDSDSSSSSSSSPSIKSAKRPQKLPPYLEPSPVAPIKKAPVQNGKMVPPGQGKPETRDRNARRRARRIAEKQKLLDGQIQPAWTETREETTHPQRHVAGPIIPPSISANLHNKNKRKGFKQAMEGLAAQKIVFGESTPSQASPSKRGADGNIYFVPPSERTDLPSNIIVTSVDVEEGMWSKRKRKDRRQQQEDIILPYDEDPLPTDRTAYSNGDAPLDELDWEAIDKNFESYSRVQDHTLKPGDTVGCKGLALNPNTRSPEILLKLAKIESIDGSTYSISIIARPGFAEEDAEEELENDLITVGADALTTEGWRFIA